MADMQFPNVLLGPGTFTAAVIDNNGAPSSVLEANQPFTIQCSWNISALAALLLGGQWQLAAYVESIGAGPEQEVGAAVTVALNGGTSYNATIVVPANTLPDDPAPPLSSKGRSFGSPEQSAQAGRGHAQTACRGPFSRSGL